jgi:hypothetical protein
MAALSMREAGETNLERVRKVQQYSGYGLRDQHPSPELRGERVRWTRSLSGPDLGKSRAAMLRFRFPVSGLYGSSWKALVERT